MFKKWLPAVPRIIRDPFRGPLTAPLALKIQVGDSWVQARNNLKKQVDRWALLKTRNSPAKTLNTGSLNSKTYTVPVGLNLGSLISRLLALGQVRRAKGKKGTKHQFAH